MRLRPQYNTTQQQQDRSLQSMRFRRNAKGEYVAQARIVEEKARTKWGAPGESFSRDQFHTVLAVLASDWCLKIFIFVPNRVAAKLGIVSCVLTRIDIHKGHLLAMFVVIVRGDFARGEKFQSQQKGKSFGIAATISPKIRTLDFSSNAIERSVDS